MAQNQADYKLISSRKGIDLSEDEMKELDKPIKKRKHNKKYDYPNNKISRSNHTYLDYLAYIHENPNLFVWQLDFLGATKSDSNNILTLIMSLLQLPILKFIKNPNAEKVVNYFYEIENKIGAGAFKALFPAILTDRDPCFNDFDGICTSKITGKERCKLFYCDSYVSSQKPNIENLNKQLRLYFPKGKSIDKFTDEKIRKINLALAERPLRSLDGHSPKEAFINVFSQELFEGILILKETKINLKSKETLN